MVGEAASQRQGELVDLGSHPPLSELGEDLRVTFTGDERVDHRPCRFGQHRRRHRRQLDPGVFEDLLDPLRFASAVLDQPLAIAGQVPQLTDLRRRHETRPQQPALQQLGQPRRVGHVGLAARQLVHITGVHEHQLEAGLLEHPPHRTPIVARRFHRHDRDPLDGEPLSQAVQVTNEGRKLAGLLPTLLAARPLRRSPNRRSQDRLADIDPAHPVNDHVHDLLLSTRYGWHARGA